jgi:ankyrin repeat protein
MKHRNSFFAFMITILLIVSGCASTSPLIEASKNGDSLAVQKLLNEGANINEPDSNGATPLIHAIWKKKTEVAKYLIQSGAEVKDKDKNGWSALTYAIFYKQHDLMKIILDKGVDIESRDYLGETALVYAALRTADFDAAKMLIKAGADANAKSYEGETVLDIFLSSMRWDILNDLGFNLWTPETGKARLIFVGRELYDFYIQVTVGKQTKTLNQSMFEGLTFIDVDSGKHDIYAYTDKNITKKPSLSIATIAGQTYYLKITQDMKRRAVHYTGIKLSSVVVTPFTATEAKAKDEIITMLKSYEFK